MAVVLNLAILATPPPKGHITTSGDIFGCDNVDVQQAEAREAAACPPVLDGRALTTVSSGPSQ